MMKRSTKRPLTILELLIVMTLIATIAGVVGFNITKMIAEQRFKSGAEQVLNHIKIAQSLMVIQGSDLKVLMKKEDASPLFLELKPDSPFSKNMERLLKQKSTINGIESIALMENEQIKSENSISLFFSSSNQEITSGTLILSAYENASEEGPLRATINLPGYPKPLKLLYGTVRIDQREEDITGESDELYPPEVREMRALEKEKAQAKKEEEEDVPTP